MKFGVYFHVPFCRVQCPYCTFYTVAKPQQSEAMQPLLDAFREEWRQRVVPRLQQGDSLETLYFGGGTPSDLPSPAVKRLFQRIGADLHGGVRAVTEVTVECNPETATADFLDTLLESGVGRVSLGVQAIHQEDLKSLGRGCSHAEVRQALLDTQARFDNFNADLIVGIPGSSWSRLALALAELIDCGAKHLSFYCLEMPPGKARRMGDLPGDASDAFKADLYMRTATWVGDQGYEHYEISNAALPGFRALHNTSYWQGQEYVGLGPGAHSCESGKRRANRPHLKSYVQALLAGGPAPHSMETLTGAMRTREHLLLGLRQERGVLLEDLPAGQPVREFMDELCENNLAILEKSRLKLTPRGWLVSDSIVLQLVT